MIIIWFIWFIWQSFFIFFYSFERWWSFWRKETKDQVHKFISLIKEKKAYKGITSISPMMKNTHKHRRKPEQRRNKRTQITREEEENTHTHKTMAYSQLRIDDNPDDPVLFWRRRAERRPSMVVEMDTERPVRTTTPQTAQPKENHSKKTIDWRLEVEDQSRQKKTHWWRSD